MDFGMIMKRFASKVKGMAWKAVRGIGTASAISDFDLFRGMV